MTILVKIRHTIRAQSTDKRSKRLNTLAIGDIEVPEIRYRETDDGTRYSLWRDGNCSHRDLTLTDLERELVDLALVHAASATREALPQMVRAAFPELVGQAHCEDPKSQKDGQQAA